MWVTLHSQNESFIPATPLTLPQAHELSHPVTRHLEPFSTPITSTPVNMNVACEPIIFQNNSSPSRNSPANEYPASCALPNSDIQSSAVLDSSHQVLVWNELMADQIGPDGVELFISMPNDMYPYDGHTEGTYSFTSCGHISLVML